MVSPGTCLFEEIDDWHGHFLIPEPDGYDWDRACEEDSRFLEAGKAVQMGFYGSFTQLYNAMGFENAMIAVAEDPDRVSELFGEMTEFLCEITRQVMKRVRIDSLSMYDDIANANSLFISRKCYQELVMPYHKRLFDTAKQMNPDISLEMHCCGKCEQIVPDFVDIGTNVWQPAQVVNDLKGLRERFGTKLVFNGAWDNIRVFGRADITEEQICQSVRDSIDRYGREGGLIFWNQQLGTGDEMMGKLAVIDNELSVYGRM